VFSRPFGMRNVERTASGVNARAEKKRRREEGEEISRRQ
jgi:hypothetical protein